MGHKSCAQIGNSMMSWPHNSPLVLYMKLIKISLFCFDNVTIDLPLPEKHAQSSLLYCDKRDSILFFFMKKKLTCPLRKLMQPVLVQLSNPQPMV